MSERHPSRPRSTSPNRQRSRAGSVSSTPLPPVWNTSSPTSSAATALSARRKKSLPSFSSPPLIAGSYNSSSSSDDAPPLPPIPPLPFPTSPNPGGSSLFTAKGILPTSPGDPFYLTKKSATETGTIMSSSSSSNKIKMREAVPRSKERANIRPNTAGSADPRSISGWSRERKAMEAESETYGGSGNRYGSSTLERLRVVNKSASAIGTESSSDGIGTALEDGIPRKSPLKTRELIGGRRIVMSDTDTEFHDVGGVQVGSFVEIIGGKIRNTSQQNSSDSAATTPTKSRQPDRRNPSPHLTKSRPQLPPQTPDEQSFEYSASHSPNSSAFFSAPTSPALWNPPSSSPLQSVSPQASSPQSRQQIAQRRPHPESLSLQKPASETSSLRGHHSMRGLGPSSPVSPSFLTSPPPDISTYATLGKKSRPRAESATSASPVMTTSSPLSRSRAGSRSEVKSTPNDGPHPESSPPNPILLTSVARLRPSLGSPLRRASENDTVTLRGLGFALGVLGSPEKIKQNDNRMKPGEPIRRGSDSNVLMEGSIRATKRGNGETRFSGVLQRSSPKESKTTPTLPYLKEEGAEGTFAGLRTPPIPPSHIITVHQASPSPPPLPFRPSRSSRRPSASSSSPQMESWERVVGERYIDSPEFPGTQDTERSKVAASTKKNIKQRPLPLETIYSSDNIDGREDEGGSWAALLGTLTSNRDADGVGDSLSPDLGGTGIRSWPSSARDRCVTPENAFAMDDLNQASPRSGSGYSLGPLSSPQLSQYKPASPRLYMQQRRANASGQEIGNGQEPTRDDWNQALTGGPFSRHASRIKVEFGGQLDDPRSRTSSSGGEASSPTTATSKQSHSDQFSLDYPPSHEVSTSPSLDIKRFSRLDLADAVNAVMSHGQRMDEEEDNQHQHQDGRGQMAKRLTAIQGLISDMGFSTRDSGLLGGDDVKRESTAGGEFGEIDTRPTDHEATPKALLRASFEKDGHRRGRDDNDQSIRRQGPASYSPPSNAHYQEWGRDLFRHHRAASSTSSHRRSASEDHASTRRSAESSYKASESAVVPQPSAMATPLTHAARLTKRPTLKHHRSTSSIDRFNFATPAQAVKMPPMPPSLKRRETFDVAVAGFSSSQRNEPEDKGENRASKTWRASIADEDQFNELANMYGKKEMKRQELIWELCETESAFLADMQLVLRRFAQPLRTPQGKWIDGIDPDITRLFDWLEDIVQIHHGINEKFLDLQARQAPMILRFAESFKPCVAHLQIHLPYLVRFEGVSRKIESMVRDPSSNIGEFVRMQTAAPESKSLSLVSYLLKPVQRLMKYPLFFKQIRDLTPADHADHGATLSLLHSTDAVIRVMQEVKAREEELESLRQLEGRIKGLPPGFVLPGRGRHLLYQGVLNRVLLSEKDQMRLSVMQDSAADSLTKTKTRSSTHGEAVRTSASTHQSAGSPLLSPASEIGYRPDSIFSEASTAESSVAPSTKSSESAFTDPRPLFRRPSVASSESSFVNGRRPSAPSVPSLPHELKEQDRPRVKAKETPLYVFVFTDIVLVTTQTSERSGLLGARRGSGTKEKAYQVSYKLIEGVGICRVLGVKDWADHLGYGYLVELDLLSLQSGESTSASATTSSTGGGTKSRRPSNVSSMMSPATTPSASTIFVTIPDRSAAKMVIAPRSVLLQSYNQWLDSLRRSCMTSQQSLTASGTLSDLVSTMDESARPSSMKHLELVSPKKGEKGSGSGGDSYADEEAAERDWWARRYRAVQMEMLRGRM